MEIKYTSTALAQLVALPARFRLQVAAAVLTLQAWPHVAGVKALKGKMKGMFRKRSGDYRIIFSVDQEKSIIVILEILNRKDSY